MDRPSPVEALPPALVERVLAKFGLTDRPDPTLANLSVLFEAWCRAVPFDNVRKLIHLRRQDPGPLPGDDSIDFFESWLQHGTGGTCWGTNGALFRLVSSLGFEAVRGESTMMVAPNIPPNHGTVVVALDHERYIVDGCILQVEPLRLDESEMTQVGHPAWGIQCEKRDGHWVISWRPGHQPDGLDCRIDSLAVTGDRFRERHDATRPWSPFNYELYARSIRGDSAITACFGRRVETHADGSVDSAPLDKDGRLRYLIDELGMSEEIVSALPDDEKTPPPPWSNTAQSAAVT